MNQYFYSLEMALMGWCSIMVFTNESVDTVRALQKLEDEENQ